MPHSIFTGRVCQPGDPQFLQEDTEAAIALAEEERDTCPKCGMQKAWCRDPAHQFAFEPVEDVCWPTHRLSEHQKTDKWTGKTDHVRTATSLAARFRDSVEPDIEAGLGLG